MSSRTAGSASRTYQCRPRRAAITGPCRPPWCYLGRVDPARRTSGYTRFVSQEYLHVRAGRSRRADRCTSWSRRVTRTFHGTVLALGVACLLTAGGCSSTAKKSTGDDGADDRPTVVATAQSMDPQQARAAVVQTFNLLADSDWAGAWSLWSDAAQAQLPQQTYVDLISTCPPPAAGDVTITDVTASDPKTVVVKWTVTKPDNTKASGQTTALYEDGAWHVVPDPAALTAYKAGHCA